MDQRTFVVRRGVSEFEHYVFSEVEHFVSLYNPYFPDTPIRVLRCVTRRPKDVCECGQFRLRWEET
jgi:hypothetical protein